MMAGLQGNAAAWKAVKVELDALKSDLADINYDDCDECGHAYLGDREEQFFHGYSHFPEETLELFALKHSVHILKPFELLGREGDVHRSFNVPLMPRQPIDHRLILFYLLRIRNRMNCTFKCKVGVTRILQNKDTKALYFFRTTHDGIRQIELEGRDIFEHLDPEELECNMPDGCGQLHPYTITNLDSCRMAATDMDGDIHREMLDRRPNSVWRLVCATNLRFYTYALDFAGGHVKDADLPNTVSNSRSIMDCVPTREHDKQLCLFYVLATYFALQRKNHG